MFETYDIYTATVGSETLPLVVGEKDGETWVRVFHHRNLGCTNMFTSKEDAKIKNKENPEADLYSILSYMNHFIGADGQYELLLHYPGQPELAGAYNHWKQTSNPMNSGVSGYTAIKVSWTQNNWSGLSLSTENNCLLDGSTGSGWWYAIGSYTPYNGGVPGGANVVITTGDIDLWVKYSSDEFKSLYETRYLYEIENVLYNEVEGELSPIEAAVLNEETMLLYGNEKYNASILASTDHIKLHVYTQDPTIVGYNFNYTALWKGQTVVQDYDFDATVAKKLTFTTTINANDVFRVLLSNDSGTSWKTLNADGAIEAADLEEIETVGMTVTQVNGLTQAQITEVIDNTGTLRVAFFMKQAKSNVAMNVDHIRFEYK